MPPIAAQTSQELREVLRQLEVLLRAGNLSQAMRSARDAADRGLVHPNLLMLAALQELEAGRPDKAHAHIARAHELAPHSPDVLHVEGMTLAGLGRHKEAVALFDRALALSPRLAAAHYNKALSLNGLHEWQRAQAEFERTLELDPRHAGALARLAAAAAARGDAGKARLYAERALSLNPRDVAALIALAQVDLEARRFDAVHDRVAPLLAAPGGSPVNRAILHGLVADALDGAGRQAEAFAHYAESNRILRGYYMPVFEAPGSERAVARARRLAAFLRDNMPVRGQAAVSREAPVPTHVFLVGFPRSGTTLLEQVLSSHPSVESLEERDCFALAMTDFVLPADGMRLLASCGDAGLSRYREAYWAEARAGGARLDKPVFLDKLPLNSLNLAVIARLFPAAKILLALRDPRDVVLSCFRRRFEISANMYEFLALGDTADFYAAVMELCELARDRLALAFHVARHEDLVADLKSHARGLCEFMGIAYDDAMLGFAENARARDIRTPSAAQVARGVYRAGVGQWRAYGGELKPVLATLSPFVARYGYEAS